MEFFEVILNFETFTQRFLAGPLMAFGGTLVGKQRPILSHPGSQVTYKNIRREIVEDRGSTVVKVLFNKSEGRWFDPSWYHSNFLLT